MKNLEKRRQDYLVRIVLALAYLASNLHQPVYLVNNLHQPVYSDRSHHQPVYSALNHKLVFLVLQQHQTVAFSELEQYLKMLKIKEDYLQLLLNQLGAYSVPQIKVVCLVLLNNLANQTHNQELPLCSVSHQQRPSLDSIKQQ